MLSLLLNGNKTNLTAIDYHQDISDIGYADLEYEQIYFSMSVQEKTKPRLKR